MVAEIHGRMEWHLYDAKVSTNGEPAAVRRFRLIGLWGSVGLPVVLVGMGGSFQKVGICFEGATSNFICDGCVGKTVVWPMGNMPV